MANVSGNGFSPIPPKQDDSGQTADEFLQMLFECEYCAECGRDEDGHIAVIGPSGQWFAYCRYEPRYDENDELIFG